MSITDELRKWGYGFCGDTHDVVTAIADRIDEKADEEATRKYLTGFDEGFASADDWLNMNEDDLSKHGWVKLPVDADGVPIRIGDVMEGVDKYDSLKKVKGKVITVSFESDGIVDVAIQAWNSDGKSWHRAYLDSGASVYRHYHAPTVEDVLREFADAMSNTNPLDVPARIAEYAAKLRLAGDGE